MTKEEAIARIKEHKIIHKMNEPRAIYISEALDMGIQALESQKTGHWIKREIEDTMRWKECSECHSEYPNMNGLNYCPNCGAKMEGA